MTQGDSVRPVSNRQLPFLALVIVKRQKITNSNKNITFKEKSNKRTTVYKLTPQNMKDWAKWTHWYPAMFLWACKIWANYVFHLKLVLMLMASTVWLLVSFREVITADIRARNCDYDKMWQYRCHNGQPNHNVLILKHAK